MKRQELAEIVAQEPMFTTGMLLGPGIDSANIRKQLSRWVAQGLVVQLRRGLYVLGDEHRRIEPHPYEISNRLAPGSYVSLETVLGEMGLIPEAVVVTTAVTTGKQGVVRTRFGQFLYQHVKGALFWGYEAREIAPGRTAFVALPEKALLDMAYLRAYSD
ncbi:MAG: type IV toxin-antitoxin system AbiEi family antitoxin domain-containing protein, partial [Actinomycetota bacterium]|nr:type IV toxin-antitoxin system AbiEi family antitoxin domain-containing protein [Actinomycetota bacterium]